MKAAPCNSQAGMGLLEVLVAVVILSIGLLGLAALQARSLSTNSTAMARSMATIASYSILDAIRADRGHMAWYNGTVNANDCDSIDSGSLAGKQLQSWCRMLRDNLGAFDATTGTVLCDGSDQCTITITFSDNSDRNKGKEASDIKTDDIEHQVVTKAIL